MVRIYLLVGKLPIYEELLLYPPDDVDFLQKSKTNHQVVKSYYLPSMYQLKRVSASFLLNTLQMPIVNYVYINQKYDLIHSNRGIIILNKKPWIIDIDYVGYFFGNNIGNRETIKNSPLKRRLERFLSSNYCKKIICWSNAAKNSVINVFEDNVIKTKVEVLYPAVPEIPVISKKGNSKVRLLYVSSSFSFKGGEAVLLAFKKLLSKYDDIELTFKCDIQENIQKKYSFKEITYVPYKSQLLPRDELIKRYYAKSDIFIYPTFGDLFGLSLLDAMAAGLPIVTTNTYAIPEIVENGENGFLIDLPFNWHDNKYLPIPRRSFAQEAYSLFVDQLVENLSILIENPALRFKMGKENRCLVENGKFSIKERNRKLKRIYEEALMK